MKLSISWIFDHIDGNWKKVDITALMNKFNTTTAEIEGSYAINLFLDNLALGLVKALNGDQMVVSCPEWNKEFAVPMRPDAQVGR